MAEKNDSPAGSRPVIRWSCFSSAPAKPVIIQTERLRNSSGLLNLLVFKLTARMGAQTEADDVNLLELQTVMFVQSFQQERELFADQSRVGGRSNVAEFELSISKNLTCLEGDFLLWQHGAFFPVNAHDKTFFNGHKSCSHFVDPFVGTA